VIASCVVGYSEASTTYRNDIPAQRKILVRRDVKFDEDVRSSS